MDILRAEGLWIRDVGAKVRRQSEEDLRTGVRQGNHIALSVALQAGCNTMVRAHFSRAHVTSRCSSTSTASGLSCRSCWARCWRRCVKRRCPRGKASIRRWR